MREISSGIYEIKNIKNGHRYVGSAVDIAARWRLHRHHLNNNKHHSIYLQRAWNKYGEVLFSFHILQIAIEKDERIEIEQKLIDELKPEYNLCKIAGTRLGTKWTEESKKKLSFSTIGRIISETTKQAVSNAHKGKCRSAETKQKISSTLSGRKYSLERRMNISAGISKYWKNKYCKSEE